MRPHVRCLLAFLLLAAHACACSVPVFRYALEHWDAAPFQAFILHRGPLTDAQQAAARDLGPDGLAGKVRANITLRTVDLDREPAPFADSPGGPLPRLVVRFPATNKRDATAWSAPLDSGNVALLLESPARAELTSRIADGQTAIWLLLESGDPAADTAAATLLEERLR